MREKDALQEQLRDTQEAANFEQQASADFVAAEKQGAAICKEKRLEAEAELVDAKEEVRRLTKRLKKTSSRALKKEQASHTDQIAKAKFQVYFKTFS